MSKTYTLHIEAYSPESIPLARLARYMSSLAALLGHENAVHFEALRPGSTQLVTRIDHEDIPKVAGNLEQLKRGDGSPDVIRAFSDIDRLLAEDNATGAIFAGEEPGAEIIAFPGVTKPRPATYGPFNQDGSLDGILVSVSGADDTVHLQLQNGPMKYTGLTTDRDTARRLAKHMYEPVRVFGVGRWMRDEEGNWILKSFRVRANDFVVLASDSLKDAILKMREIEGGEWSSVEDPIGTLAGLREKGNGLH